MCGTQKEFLTIFIKRNNTMAMKKKGYAKGGMKKKGYARGGMPMTKDPKTGRMVPSFAMDGKGKMSKGGMMKKKGYAKGGSVKKPAKKPTMTLAQIRAAAKAKGYKLVKIT